MYLLLLWISLLSSSQLSQAKKLIVQERYQDAITVLEGIADARARYYGGWCHMQMGDCARANPEFQVFITTYDGEGAIAWKEEARVNMLSCSQDFPVTVEPVDTPVVDAPSDDPEDTSTTVSIWPEQKSGILITKVSSESIKIWPLEKTGLQVVGTIIKDDKKTDEGLSSVSIWPEKKDNTLYLTAEPTSTVKIWPENKSGIRLPVAPAPESVKIWPPEKTDKLVANEALQEIDIWPIEKRGLELPFVFSNTNNDKRKPVVSSPKEEKKVIDNEIVNPISNRQQHYRILFSVEKDANKSFLSLSSLGPISSEEVKSGYHLYYVGYFKNKDSAEKALKRVIDQGFKAAEIAEFGKQK